MRTEHEGGPKVTMLDENNQIEIPPAPQPEGDPVDEAPAPEPEGDPADTPQPPEGEEAAPEYTPNYNYKVYDEEKEFPEMVRGHIDSVEKEEFYRSLFCKADGLDGMKPKHEKVVKERDEIKDHYGKLNEGFTTLEDFRKGDLPMFFDTWGFSNKELIDYVSNLPELKDDPSAVQAFTDRLTASKQRYQSQYQHNDLQRENERLRQNFENVSVAQALMDPEMGSFAKHFDSVKGVGSFNQQVTDYIKYAGTQNQTVTPQQAAAFVHNYYKDFMQPAAVQQPGNGGTPPAPAPTDTPTIPDVGTGRRVSPAKPVFKSLADLKKHAENLAKG